MFVVLQKQLYHIKKMSSCIKFVLTLKSLSFFRCLSFCTGALFQNTLETIYFRDTYYT